MERSYNENEDSAAMTCAVLQRVLLLAEKTKKMDNKRIREKESEPAWSQRAAGGV